MSIEQAAGFAMAPSADEMVDAIEFGLDDGHDIYSGSETVARDVHVAMPRITLGDPGRTAWLRDMLFGWWAGKAPA